MKTFEQCLEGSERFDAPGQNAECLTCGVRGFDMIKVQMSQSFESLTVEIACRRCETEEQVHYYPTGEVKTTVRTTSWKTAKDIGDTQACTRCGAQVPALQVVLIEHQRIDGKRKLLRMCSKCAKAPLCPASPDGQTHGQVLSVVYGDEEYADRWRFNPRPDKTGYGLCESCGMNLYWAWTEGCTGEWRAMTWPALAEHWEAESRDRVTAGDDEVLAFSMDSSCRVTNDAWCDTHKGWHV